MATYKLSVKPEGGGGAKTVYHPIQVDKKTSAHFML